MEQLIERGRRDAQPWGKRFASLAWRHVRRAQSRPPTWAPQPFQTGSRCGTPPFRRCCCLSAVVPVGPCPPSRAREGRRKATNGQLSRRPQHPGALSLVSPLRLSFAALGEVTFLHRRSALGCRSEEQVPTTFRGVPLCSRTPMPTRVPGKHPSPNRSLSPKNPTLTNAPLKE